MLQREKLDALFQLLKEMTLCSRGNGVSGFSRWMRRIGTWLIIAFVVTMALLVIVALGYRSRPNPPGPNLPDAINCIYLVGILWAMLYMLTIVADVVATLWRSYRKHPHAILDRLHDDLLEDAKFLARLQSFDKPTLEYGRIQYRHNYAIADGRVTLLAGDLRKIGLFPALVAAAAAAAALLKSGMGASLLWAPLILACCFYLVSLVVTGRRERVAQVIALVEHGIAHAGELPTAPLAVGTRPPPAADVSALPTAR